MWLAAELDPVLVEEAAGRAKEQALRRQYNRIADLWEEPVVAPAGALTVSTGDGGGGLSVVEAGVTEPAAPARPWWLRWMLAYKGGA